MTGRTSTSSERSTSSTASVEYIKARKPADICIPKGKWYDCLRPVPGYSGFGGMDNFTMMNGHVRPDLEEGNWTEEIHASMYENKGKQATR